MLASCLKFRSMVCVQEIEGETVKNIADGLIFVSRSRGFSRYRVRHIQGKITVIH